MSQNLSALDPEAQFPGRRPHRPGRAGTMAEALELIEDGALVYVASLMGTPTAVLEAMADAPQRWQRLITSSDYLLAPLATFDRPGDLPASQWPFSHLSVQPSMATSSLEAERLRTVHAHSSQFYGLYRPGGPLAVDVAIVQVSEPGPDGRFSLGLLGGAALELIYSAPLVIAEVNPLMPYTRGPAALHRECFDLLVEVEHELVTLESTTSAGPEPGSVAARIAEHVAGEVADGATIEYGIGAIPDAVLHALSSHSGLGLHSGLLGDAAAALIDGGAMDGSAKSFDQGLHVASGVIGSRHLIEWVRGRDDVVMVASRYSHAVPVLARHDGFTAINSAVEIALDGSINAEQIGERVVSGPGGQPDFAAGAALAPDGRSFVVLPATAKKGTRSRIVPRLSDGVPTTVPRYLADRVVTEYGSAVLLGADRAERRQRLLAVAEPELRATIEV